MRNLLLCMIIAALYFAPGSRAFAIDCEMGACGISCTEGCICTGTGGDDCNCHCLEILPPEPSALVFRGTVRDLRTRVGKRLSRTASRCLNGVKSTVKVDLKASPRDLNLAVRRICYAAR